MKILKNKEYKSMIDYQVEQLSKICDLQKENKRLNNIIKEAREYMDRRDLEWDSDEHNTMMSILQRSDKE